MSLTQQARRNHAIYEALPPAYRCAIDEAYTAMRKALVEHTEPCQFVFECAGDDRAEECVSGITAYVIASNPDNGLIKAAIAEVDVP